MAQPKDFYSLDEICMKADFNKDDVLFAAAQGKVLLHAFLDSWKAHWTRDNPGDGEDIFYEDSLVGYEPIRQEDIAQVRGARSVEVSFLKKRRGCTVQLIQNSNRKTAEKLPSINQNSLWIHRDELQKLRKLLDPSEAEQLYARWKEAAKNLQQEHPEWTKVRIAAEIKASDDLNPKKVGLEHIRQKMREK